VNLLQYDDKSLVLIGYLLDDRDLACGKPLGDKLQYTGSSGISGSRDAAKGVFLRSPR